MAERRMFSKKITDSDSFIDLSAAAQALYFHLNQGADDDGFTNQVQEAMWKSHASIDDLKVLLGKNFILRFENGVIVIKHWRMHNTLRKDRYTPTNFQEEFKRLGIKETKAYTLDPTAKPAWLPNGCHREEEDRLGKDNIFLSSAYARVSLSEEEKAELENNLSQEDMQHYIEAIITCEGKGKRYKNKTHYEAIISMAKKDGKYGAAVENNKTYNLDEFYEAAVSKATNDIKKEQKGELK